MRRRRPDPAVSDPKNGRSAMESVQSEAFRRVEQLPWDRLEQVPAEFRANRGGGAVGYVCTVLAAPLPARRSHSGAIAKRRRLNGGHGSLVSWDHPS